MDAPSLPTESRRSALPFFRQFQVALIGLAIGLLMMVALLLTVRRLAGGLSAPLPPPALVASGLFIAAVAAALRQMALWCPHCQGRTRLAFVVTPTVPVCVSAAAISLPGSSVAGVSVLWCIVLAIEISSYVALRSHWPGASSSPVQRPRHRSSKKNPQVRFDVPHAAAEPHMLATGLAQRIERGVTDEAEEFCHGLLRASFEPTQRTETVHVSFCPPFLTIPEFHVEQIDGPDAKIKVAQVLPYGARVEIRLNRAPSASVQTVLEFSAIARGG